MSVAKIPPHYSPHMAPSVLHVALPPVGCLEQGHHFTTLPDDTLSKMFV